MVDTAIVPACAKDLKKTPFVNKKFADTRKAAYEAVLTETTKLKTQLANHADTVEILEKEATFLRDVLKPQMEKVRGTVDRAEGLMDVDLYPYPSYETMLYSHHFEEPPMKAF